MAANLPSVGGLHGVGSVSGSLPAAATIPGAGPATPDPWAPTVRFVIGYGIAFTIISILTDLGSPLGAGFAVLLMTTAILTEGDVVFNFFSRRSGKPTAAYLRHYARSTGGRLPTLGEGRAEASINIGRARRQGGLATTIGTLPVIGWFFNLITGSSGG